MILLTLQDFELEQILQELVDILIRPQQVLLYVLTLLHFEHLLNLMLQLCHVYVHPEVAEHFLWFNLYQLRSLLCLLE